MAKGNTTMPNIQSNATMSKSVSKFLSMQASLFPF
jgi:hypothetical protein